MEQVFSQNMPEIMQGHDPVLAGIRRIEENESQVLAILSGGGPKADPLDLFQAYGPRRFVLSCNGDNWFWLAAFLVAISATFWERFTLALPSMIIHKFQKLSNS
jgi:hypothetical protein